MFLELRSNGESQHVQRLVKATSFLCYLLQFPVTPNQVVSRAVMLQSGFRLTLEFWDNPLGQHLSNLDAPLMEGVDMPDRPLGKTRLLLKSDEFAEALGGEPLGEDRIRWTVALEYASRYE